MKNRILLSHIITEDTPAYGNKDRITIKANSSISNGDTANTASWFFSNNHIGTHMDSAYHFCENGAKTFEIPLDDYFFNNVSLIDIPATEAKLIGITDVINAGTIHPETELLLIRTGFEKYRYEEKYWSNNPGLAPELADYFRSNFPDLRCVGFDFISLTSYQYRPEGRLSHKAFLCPPNGEKSVLVIEDMALAKITGQLDAVIVAPLFVQDGNGGAVTVFATLS